MPADLHALALPLCPPVVNAPSNHNSFARGLPLPPPRTAPQRYAVVSLKDGRWCVDTFFKSLHRTPRAGPIGQPAHRARQHAVLTD
jgi:hypothetical protein